MGLLGNSPINVEKYSWEKLCQNVLQDAIKHLVPIICGDRMAGTRQTMIVAPPSTRQISPTGHTVKSNFRVDSVVSTTNSQNTRDVTFTPMATTPPPVADSNLEQISSPYTPYVPPAGSTNIANEIIMSAINARFGKGTGNRTTGVVS
jgi:hypothetical protein